MDWSESPPHLPTRSHFIRDEDSFATHSILAHKHQDQYHPSFGYLWFLLDIIEQTQAAPECVFIVCHYIRISMSDPKHAPILMVHKDNYLHLIFKSRMHLCNTSIILRSDPNPGRSINLTSFDLSLPSQLI